MPRSTRARRRRTPGLLSLAASFAICVGAFASTGFAADSSRYFAGHANHRANSQVGLEVANGRVERIFVAAGARCQRAQRSRIKRFATIAKKLRIDKNGGFLEFFDKDYGERLHVKYLVKGVVRGGRVEGRFRQRSVFEFDRGNPERCMSGRLRFDVGRVTERSFERRKALTGLTSPRTRARPFLRQFR